MGPGLQSQHSSFEAVEDGSWCSENEWVEFHLVPFLFRDLTERSVLLSLGFVFVFISCIRDISNLQYCDLPWANHVLEHGLLIVQQIASRFFSVLLSMSLKDLVVRSRGWGILCPGGSHLLPNIA